MKRLVVLSVIVLAILAGCCDRQVDKDRQALDKAIAAFYKAVEDGDGKAATDLFADDFIMMPNGGAIKQGKDKIAANWADNVTAGFRLRNVRPLETVISGSIAYRINEYDYGFPDDSGQMQWWPTKNIHIWKKQCDGNWKLHADMWNSSPMPAGPAETPADSSAKAVK